MSETKILMVVSDFEDFFCSNHFGGWGVGVEGAIGGSVLMGDFKKMSMPMPPLTKGSPEHKVRNIICCRLVHIY